MSLFLQILGANLTFLWMMGKVLDKKVLQILPSPYAELFLEYSWLMAGIGIPLVLIAQVLKLIARRDLRKIQTKTSLPNKLSENYVIKRNNNNTDLEVLGLEIDWSPLCSGGANFKTSNLHNVNEFRIIIKSSGGAKLFAGFFIALGLFIPGGIAYMDYRDQGLEWSLLFPLLGSLVFVAAGIAMMYFPRPRYLDKRLGWFWAGAKEPKGERALRQLANASPLNDLVALQIIAEEINGKNMTYTSWELNVISKDNTRYNLLDHGDKYSLLKDAETIATFLSIPILDNT